MYETKSIELIPLFEAYNNQVIIIVDVQKPFERWWKMNGKDNLPEEIDDYCLNFPFAIQIWDDHKAKGPDKKFNNEVFAIQKHYGVDHADGEIHDYSKYFDDKTYQDVISMVKSNVVQPKMWKTKDGNFAVLVNGSHKWFFPTEEMVTILDSITGDIVLVGGAEGECLKDIEVLLQLLGKKYTVNRKYCYNAQDKAQDNAQNEDSSSSSSSSSSSDSSSESEEGSENSDGFTTL